MNSTTRDGILRGGTATLIRLFLLAAAAVSGYLLSVSLNGGRVMGCGIGSDCDAVLQSRWAYVLGVPVSTLALLVDFAVLAATFSCGAKSTPKQRRGAWEILAPGSVLLLGAGLWFTALQALVLHRFCPWCLTAHACGATAALLLLTRVPVTDASVRRDKDPAVPRATLIKFSALALLALALLGVAQTFAPGKSYSVTVMPAMPSAANTLPASNAPANAAVSSTLPATNLPATAVVAARPRTFEVFGGRVRLDLEQVPVWGSPDAPYKLISLYDYTCHLCREMHERVAAVQRSFGGQFAVISLPMPLDSQCNPLIVRTPRPHTNACVYAKLGLSVWRANREAVQPFDDWLFGFPKPPPLTDVTNKAVELVGRDAFERASHDPWIEEQLRTDINLFTISSRAFRDGSNMPQFLIGTNLITGVLTTEELRAKIAPYVQGLGIMR